MTLAGMVIDLSPQLPKAASPMDLTPSGMSIDISPLYSKALGPISVNPLPRVTDDNALQY